MRTFLLRKNVKFILIGLLFLYPIPHILYPTSAAESTPSADVQSKLKALQIEIASKAAKLKTEISKKLQNKAYIGTVKSKTASTITLASRSATKLININQDTVYGSSTTKKIIIKDEDSIAALGDVDENGVLTARKIVILPSSSIRLPTSILWGQVISVSDELATIQDKSLKNVAVSLTKISSPKPGQYVILVGQKGKNDILAADFLYVIPGKEAPIKVATPSAEASKSATP